MYDVTHPFPQYHCSQIRLSWKFFFPSFYLPFSSWPLTYSELVWSTRFPEIKEEIEGRCQRTNWRIVINKEIQQHTTGIMYGPSRWRVPWNDPDERYLSLWSRGREDGGRRGRGWRGLWKGNPHPPTSTEIVSADSVSDWGEYLRTTGPGPLTTLDLTHVRHSRLYNLVDWTIKILNGNKSHKRC